MPPTPNSFSLELTPAELAWLAGAFGQTRLLLPEPPLQRLLDDELAAELATGQISLAQRGIIQRVVGAGWQVDPALAAIVQMLGSPERTLSLLRLSRSGEESRAMAYRAGGMHLLLEMPPTYRFTFCQDGKTLIERLLAGVESGSRPTAGAGRSGMTLADVDRLFPHAWREEPSLVETTEAILLSVRDTGKENKPRRGLLLLGPSLQGGEVDARGQVRLEPLPANARRDLILSFIES